MKDSHFSLILLPTLGCNADCEYCFERRSSHRLTLEQLSTILQKVMDHLEDVGIGSLSIYWQGGEVMTMEPEWFERAHEIILEVGESRRKCIINHIQSNMITYSSRWNRVLSEMFGNSVGSSMDYPNLHRKTRGGSPQEYERIWRRKILDARGAGVEVGIISIPNRGTLEIGAERFYSYFVDELGIRDFQINTPFPGGESNEVKEGYPLDTTRLGRLFTDLARIWVDRGLHEGVRIGPFDRLMNYFVHGAKDLLCIWQDSCTNDFLCIDPEGQVSQCDCWVASYPEFRFGNVFDSCTLSQLMQSSEARLNLQRRPGSLMEIEDCIDCSYLGVCHGGCPVRAYSVYGTLRRKDPYCQLYRSIFQCMEATEIHVPDATRLESTRS